MKNTKSFRGKSSAVALDQKSLGSLSDVNTSIGDLNSNIKDINEKLETSNDSFLDNNVVDISQAIDKTNESVQDSGFKTTGKLDLVNGNISSLSSNMEAVYAKLNEKIANEPDYEPDIKQAESIIANKVEEKEQTQDQPKIISLLEDIHEAVSNQPEVAIMKQEIVQVTLDAKKERAEQSEIRQRQQGETNRRIDKLAKATRNGFRRMLVMSDKISQFLFRFSVAAVARFAKIAAMILALIIPLDMIQLSIRKWFENFSLSDMVDGIKESFSNFGSNLKEFLQNLDGGIRNWYNGMVEGIGSEIAYQMSKVISKIVGVIPGMKDKSDSVRQEGIENYISKGGTLNESDMNYLVDKRLSEYKTKSEYKQDYEAIKNLDIQTQRDTIQHKEELEQQINKIENQLNNRYISRDEKESIREKLTELTHKTTDDEILMNMETTNVDILSKINELLVINETITSSGAKQVNEATEVTNELEERLINTEVNTTNNTNNTQINQSVSRSKTVIQKPVQTSTPAPGMYNALGGN